MTEPQSDFDDLTQVVAARRRIFTTGWFGDLLAGRLGLGDTFWIGNYGVGLIFLPIVVFVPMLAGIFIGPGIERVLNVVLYGALTLYLLALTRAVFRTARRTPDVGGWRWAGLVVTALQALQVGLLTLVFLFEGTT